MTDANGRYRPDSTKPVSKEAAAATPDVRSGLQAAAIEQAVVDHLRYSIGCLASIATPHDYYHALALAVRDRMQHRWTNTTQTYFDLKRKVACYLSAEFLLGPHLGNNLVNLDIEQAARSALARLGQDLDTILACEEEPGLGNGGLGRLAACYLDSLATLQRPAIGYGIRYEFGIFDQEIRDGWQAEITDKWLRYGNPWEIAKSSFLFPRSSFLVPRSSFLVPRSSFLVPRSSFLVPRSSFLVPRSDRK